MLYSLCFSASVPEALDFSTNNLQSKKAESGTISYFYSISLQNS